MPEEKYYRGKELCQDLLNQQICGCQEFVLGIGELDPGCELPLQMHSHVRCDYIISGQLWVRLGRMSVELAADSATCFPAGVPHSYKVIGNEPVSYLYVYATEEKGSTIVTQSATEEIANQFDINNLFETRWAVADDFEDWLLWEPSKGKRGLHWKTLFDAQRGGLREMLFGTLFLPPNGRYAPHHHEQPELFYCLSGQGVMTVNGEKFEVNPGMAAYIPKWGVHTIDNTGDERLRMIWVYGIEVAGTDWSWTPVEAITLQAGG